MSDLRLFGALLAAGLLGGLVSHGLTPTPVLAQTADSGGRYVAATAEFQSGVSVLYVLDQENQALAVYQAEGGAPNSRNIVFVGARNISLDTQLPAFNDESEFSHLDLKKEFEKKKIPIAEAQDD